MLLSKEHYDLMAQFEKEFKGDGRFDREKNKEIWMKGNVYEDGQTNRLFLAYARGYAFGKVSERFLSV